MEVKYAMNLNLPLQYVYKAFLCGLIQQHAITLANSGTLFSKLISSTQSGVAVREYLVEFSNDRR